MEEKLPLEVLPEKLKESMLFYKYYKNEYNNNHLNRLPVLNNFTYNLKQIGPILSQLWLRMLMTTGRNGIAAKLCYIKLKSVMSLRRNIYAIT